jgi:hypothetical protein
MPIPIIIKIEKTTIMMTGTAMGSLISEVKRKKNTDNVMNLHHTSNISRYL